MFFSEIYFGGKYYTYFLSLDNFELNRLIENVSKRNCRKSFDKIFDYFYPKLVDFAYLYLESRESAEEVASDVLLKIFMRRQSLLFINKLESYLYKSVKNQSISYLRKAKKDQQFFALDDGPISNRIIEEDSSPERKYIQEEFYSEVIRIIDGMPPRRKMIFKLIRQDGKSYKEAAGLLNISVKTVEVHMGLAMGDLRKELELYERQNRVSYLSVVKSLILFFASVI